MALLMEHNDGASVLLVIAGAASYHLPFIFHSGLRVLVRRLSPLLFLHLWCFHKSLLFSNIKPTLFHLFSLRHLTLTFIFVHFRYNVTDQQLFFGITVLI